MATTIAVSGKGGSGKTTLAALIIRLVSEQAHKSVLAVDADPNSCLGLTCGVEPAETIAQIREKVRQKQPDNTGMDRIRSFEYDMQRAMTEARSFDLLTMGIPEGPSCYCAANNILRDSLDKMSDAYDFVVLDNEAGMEHLSRRTTNDVDLLCIVAAATAVGLLTARRIYDVVEQLPITVKDIGIIWNSTAPRAGLPGGAELEGIDVLGHVPFDESIFDAAVQGKSIFDIDSDGPALLAVRHILEQKEAI